MAIFITKELVRLIEEKFKSEEKVDKETMYDVVTTLGNSNLILEYNLGKLSIEDLEQLFITTDATISLRKKSSLHEFIIIYDQFNPIASIRKDRTDLLRLILNRVNQDSDVDYINSFELKTKIVTESVDEMNFRDYPLIEDANEVADLDTF